MTEPMRKTILENVHKINNQISFFIIENTAFIIVCRRVPLFAKLGKGDTAKDEFCGILSSHE